MRFTGMAVRTADHRRIAAQIEVASFSDGQRAAGVPLEITSDEIILNMPLADIGWGPR